MSLFEGQITEKTKQTMLIKSILYKFEENGDYAILPIRSMSGTITLRGEPVRQNFIEKAECSSYIPFISSEMKTIITKLSKTGGIFSIIDNNGLMHQLGTDDLKAILIYEEKNEGFAGAKYGYDIKITYSSPVGIPVQSFTEDAY